MSNKFVLYDANGNIIAAIPCECSIHINESEISHVDDVPLYNWNASRSGSFECNLTYINPDALALPHCELSDFIKDEDTGLYNVEFSDATKKDIDEDTLQKYIDEYNEYIDNYNSQLYEYADDINNKK